MENNINIELRAILYSHKLRDTPERRMILAQIYKEEDVFTASDIWNYLDEMKFYVSLATVYNTLILFEDLGMIEKVPTVDGKRTYKLKI
ncbi:transcriptional repressor [Dysgonomonas sp. Marseille-P4677]|uniref:Fur family transcriptional regulator n=1 Tax=Dysgonomonas sp. Marseille-P4677 TaxID=2364790 RepID=UPI0019125F57|nr:transcriptional repressor [Dysgonomonas sp. Marseille-P4677]MBK5721408.1 transcriptional repressor [Dysgonomonas sp. Marseille-P4677]